MKKSHPQFQSQLSEDLKRLKARLESLCSGKLATKDMGRLRLLDLACGECFEAEMLARFMREIIDPGDKSSGKELEIDFVGMDIRETEIARARERCRGDQKTDFQFLAKDGKQLSTAPELDGEFDVVFIRHQNYYLGGKEWHELFEKSLEKLSPDGRLIITSYFDHEHELAKKAIKQVGGSLIEDVVNQEARALSASGKYVDKRLTLFRRK